MFATFLGFWAAAAVWELALLGLLILACILSSAGTLWRWEKGDDGNPAWAYVWLLITFLAAVAFSTPNGVHFTVDELWAGILTAGKYVVEYLAVGLVYALGLLVWTFVRGRSALAELVAGLIDYKPLFSKPSYGNLRSYAEIQDQSNGSTLFAKYFFGHNAFFALKEGFNVTSVEMETDQGSVRLVEGDRFKLIVSNVSVQKTNVLCAFLNNMFLWAALLPARIFKDWLVDFGRWIVETVSKFGLNYVKSALKA